jgi:2-polyprenyl-6-methoxyphenol hydroxylase-like FAD-dependent oxidoreductase
MNLGLRDAVGLGPVLAAHFKSPNTIPLPPDLDKGLRDYASARHARGLEIIQMTKWLLSFANALKPHRFISYFTFWFITFLARFQFIKTAAAWRLSGLGKM